MAPPITTTAPTILTLKQNFLTTQTRLLAQAPEPSRAWRRGNNNNGEVGSVLPEKALNDAFYRLNHTIQQHARRVYAGQATRHVAEQLESLYLRPQGGGGGVGGEKKQERRRNGQQDGDDGREEEEAAGSEEEEDDDQEAWMFVGADLAHPTTIATLPHEWWQQQDAYPNSAQPSLDAKRYAERAADLQALSARRAEAEARVLRLRRMKALLAPFVVSPTNNDNNNEEEGLLQNNLVTRDGEVEKELEHMRVLLVRVADKVARLRGANKEEDGDDNDDELFGEGEAMIVDDVEVVERRKVQVLLDDMR